jgi:hypothetical protein
MNEEEMYETTLENAFIIFGGCLRELVVVSKKLKNDHSER